ncbi:MAG: DNA-directed RNA polymerase subunit alpha C-terminal domain-containing protein, partial [Cetobacterium sp.]
RMDHLRVDLEEEEEIPTSTNKADDIMNTRIEELDLTVRSFNCLKKAGIEEVGQLAKMSMNELLKIKNLGRKSLDEILEKMKELGFDLNGNGSVE